MSNFRKYSEIDNHYNFKIERVLNNNNLNNMKFICQNKLDGSNISLIFTEQGNAKIASRNQYLGNADSVSFMGCSEVFKIEIYKEFIDFWSKKAKTDSKEYQFYGEIFGKGIQNRVNYGLDKRILFFDLRVNGNWVSQSEFFKYMSCGDFDSLIVPTVYICNGIEEALQASCDFKDPMFPEAEGDNWSEGFVIKPLNSVVYDCYGERLIIKKKSELFSENKKRKGPKEPKEKTDMPEGLAKMIEEFSEYINENRVLSFFSKEGRIENMKEIPKFLPGIMEDAFKDFSKDKEIDLGKEERKVLGNYASKEIVNLLKKSMLGDF